MKHIYPITPCPKPRMTRGDRYKRPMRPEVARYWAFKDEVRIRGVVLPEDGAKVIFIMPMPKSWSEKKKKEMDGMMHKQKPDLDNLMKALGDAVYDDDSRISSLDRLGKQWGREGLIIIETGEEDG